MKRFYITKDTWLQYSEKEFKKLPNVNLTTDKDEIIKAKRIKAYRYDKKDFVILAPVDMFEEEGAEDDD